MAATIRVLSTRTAELNQRGEKTVWLCDLTEGLEGTILLRGPKTGSVRYFQVREWIDKVTARVTWIK